MGNIKSQRFTTQIQLLIWRRGPRMDSNSTLAANLHCSSWKGEHCCLKRYLQEGDLFYDSLIISDGKSRPLNLWAVIASMTLLSFLLLVLVLIPLLHVDVLQPQRRTLTMLYLPPAAAASSNVGRVP